MATGPACLVEVRVTPRSRQPSVMIDGDQVRIRVPEAPFDGQATDASRRVLAAALDIPTVAVSLTTGRRSRTKLFRVDGLTRSQVWVRLGG